MSGGDLSPDGQLLAVGGGHGGVTLYDLASGAAVRALELPEAERTSTRVFRNELGQEVNRTTGRNGVLTVLISPDGRWVGASYTDGAVRVWEVATGRMASAVRQPQPGDDLPRVRSTPDSRPIDTVGADAWLPDPATGRPVPTNLDRVPGNRYGQFTPDGRWLTTVAGERRLYDAATGWEVLNLTALGFRTADLGQDGALVATDPVGELMYAPAPRDRPAPAGTAVPVSTRSELPRPDLGELSAVQASHPHRALIVRIETGIAVVPTFAGPADKIEVGPGSVLARAERTGSILVGCDDGSVRVLTPAAKTAPRRAAPNRPPGSRGCRRRGPTRRSTGWTGPRAPGVSRWRSDPRRGPGRTVQEVKAAEVIWESPRPVERPHRLFWLLVGWGGLSAVTHGELAAAGFARGDGTTVVHVWDARTRKPLFDVPAGPVPSWTPVHDGTEGHVLATGDKDGTVRLWDGRTGRALDRFAAHTGPVTAVVFSADGSRLVSTGEDRTIRVRDVAAGREVAATPPLSHPGRALALAPDGRRVVLLGGDGRSPTDGLWVWDPAPAGRLERLTGGLAVGGSLSVVVSLQGKYARAYTLGPGGTVVSWRLP